MCTLLCTVDLGRTILGMLRTCARVPRARARAARAKKIPPALQRYFHENSLPCSFPSRHAPAIRVAQIIAHSFASKGTIRQYWPCLINLTRDRKIKIKKQVFANRPWKWLQMTRLVIGYNLRGKTGIKINFRESYESKTHFLVSYFHVTAHFPNTIHIQF